MTPLSALRGLGKLSTNTKFLAVKVFTKARLLIGRRRVASRLSLSAEAAVCLKAATTVGETANVAIIGITLVATAGLVSTATGVDVATAARTLSVCGLTTVVNNRL